MAVAARHSRSRRISGRIPEGADRCFHADGVVNGADLTILLGCWGDITDPACASADIAEPPDGTINGADLTTMLSNWTP